MLQVKGLLQQEMGKVRLHTKKYIGGTVCKAVSERILQTVVCIQEGCLACKHDLSKMVIHHFSVHVETAYI